mmetsp:Transcript_25250/g.65615  ORF Transcript_25250/g.65615 Transcript_25250/m.65615 type:complete len:270 (+) Transcript_25250:663-1472(+)
MQGRLRVAAAAAAGRAARSHVSAPRAARAGLWLRLPAAAAGLRLRASSGRRLRLPAASTGLRAAWPAPAAAAPAGLLVRAAGASAGASAGRAALPSISCARRPSAVPPAGRPGATTLPSLPAARWPGAALPALSAAAGAAAATVRWGSSSRVRRPSASELRRCASSGLRCASGPTAVWRSARTTIRRRAAPGTTVRRAAPGTKLRRAARRRAAGPTISVRRRARLPSPRRRRAASTPGTVVLSSLRPIEIRYDETLRDERRPAEIETSL